MIVGQDPGQVAVDFLGERPVFVPGAQTGFDVAHGNFQVEGRQGRHEGGGGVAVHQHQVRLLLAQHLFQAEQAPGW